MGAGAEEGEACELVGLRPGEEVMGVGDFFLPWSWGMVVRMMNRTKMTEMMVRPNARMERPCGEVKRSSMVSSPPSSVWLASDTLRGVASVARGMVVSRSSSCPFRLTTVWKESCVVLGWVGCGVCETGAEADLGAELEGWQSCNLSGASGGGCSVVCRAGNKKGEANE